MFSSACIISDIMKRNCQTGLFSLHVFINPVRIIFGRRPMHIPRVDNAFVQCCGEWTNFQPLYSRGQQRICNDIDGIYMVY